MKAKLLVIAVLFALAVLQATLGESLSIYGVRPSLVLIAVYAFSIIGGEWRGILYGLVGGLFEDCLSGGFMGLFLSGYTLVGYLAGRLGRRVFNIGEAANFGGIFFLSLVQGLYTTVVMGMFTEGYGPVRGVVRFALPYAAYNAFAGTLILWYMRKEIASRVPWLRPLMQAQVRY